jgi:hypothetical protein
LGRRIRTRQYEHVVEGELPLLSDYIKLLAPRTENGKCQPRSLLGPIDLCVQPLHDTLVSRFW